MTNAEDRSQLPESEDAPPPSESTTGLRFLIGAGLLMLAGLLLLAWLGTSQRSGLEGQPLPAIDLQPLIGTDRGINKQDLIGKVSVIHFWGTWCPPCKAEFPEFVKVFSPFQDQEGLAVVSVSCSPGPEYNLEELREKTLQFLADYDFPYPTYADPAALTRQQLSLLSPSGSFAYPTTIVADRNGIIIAAVVGYREGEMQKLGELVRSKLGS